MENLDLYKEFYFREIDRKDQLNRAVNIPILVISAIISIQFYLFNHTLSLNVLTIGKVFGSLTFLSLLISLFYLVKSYSNFFLSHTYKELANMVEVRNFETKLIEEQGNKKDAEFLFYEYLIDEFSSCAKHNFIVNKIRTEDLAHAKKILFISVFLTVIFSMIYIFSIIK